MLSIFFLSLQTLEEEKERKSECLPPEPPADDPESVKIVFKLPNDTRVERRFLFGQSLTVSTTVTENLRTHPVDLDGLILPNDFQEIWQYQRVLTLKYHIITV